MKCLAAIPLKEETLRLAMHHILTALTCLTVGAMIIISFYAISQVAEAKRYRPSSINSNSDDAIQQYSRSTVTEQRRERCERDIQNSTFSMYTWPLIDTFVTILAGIGLMCVIGVSFCQPGSAYSLGSFVSVSPSACYCIFLVAWTIPGYIHLIKYSPECRLVFFGIWKACFLFIVARWALVGLFMVGLLAAIAMRIVLWNLPSEASLEPSVRPHMAATYRHHVANSLTTSDESLV
jgi:hypothetical protein